ncbi:hypothetical protein ACIBEJ_39685 [Nonomuraea sp. NPDC050790]|uniref:hypothetical protein n=1 Tax=Nonomuraea sp. NPDC050790 TaxID=3364371 RepID=UPI0037B88323
MRARTRRLHAAGRDYIWTARLSHVSGDSDCHRCVRVRVWGAGKNSQALHADLLSKAVLPWGCATDDSHPTPADVLQLITHALAQGWNPDHVGGSFFLSEAESDFDLPGFLLTDRLRDTSSPDPTARVLHAFKARR